MGKCGVGLVMVLLALTGCGDDSTPPASPPASGAGVTQAGAGAGGSTAAGAGAGGTKAGAGGATAGGGAGSAAMMIGGKPGCEAAMPGMPAALHASAVAAITQISGPMASCAGSSSCHQMMRPKAKLPLGGATNLNMLLVGKPACEAPMLSLVSSAGGNMGLANSWLWLKLVSLTDASGNISTMPAWGTPGTDCGISMPGTAGMRMPMGFAGDIYAGDELLGAVRNWICAGAPGP